MILPDHAVCQPPQCWDVIPTSSPFTVNNVGYRGDFKQIQSHLGNRHHDEDWHDGDHDCGQVRLLAAGGGQPTGAQEDLVVDDCQEEDWHHASRQQGVHDLGEYSELNIAVIVPEHVSDDGDLKNLNQSFIYLKNKSFLLYFKQDCN